MKEFTRMVLAVICGVFLVTILLIAFGVMSFGALLAAGSAVPQLPKEGVLKIDMSSLVVSEQTTESNPLASIQGSAGTTIGLWDAVRAINKAAEDPSIKYIYLLTDGNATGVSTSYELRKALSNFRHISGKPVIAYMESPTTGSYFLASVADKIFMTEYPGATTQVTGVSSQMIFFGDLLKQFDVEVQLIRHGKYKSAGEQFTRGNSSPENREQYQRLVDSMWESMCAEIAESRDLTMEHINSAIDNLELCVSEDFLKHGLVDELVSSDRLKEKLATFAVKEDFKDVKMISLPDYVSAKVLPNKSKQKIAVIYANGEIVDGSSNSGIAGDRFANIISKVRADSTVKAVVLRVNSPGGSVLASEKIKHELDLLGKDKPLVASYGEYAASGGYWISNNADKIFTDATTLTGSIGVFSMIPNLGNTAKNLAHVGVETVTSNKHGNLFDLMHHFDDAEYNYMLRSVEEIYDRFTTIVSEGRGIEKDMVDEIGQGRVWTGADAVTLHLADQIGTLEDAISYAAVLAGDSELASWNVKEYPRPLTQMEQIMSLIGESPEDDLISSVKALKEPRMMARIPYLLEIK